MKIMGPISKSIFVEQQKIYGMTVASLYFRRIYCRIGSYIFHDPFQPE